jgi:uncharacterized protein YidB (DUF937 family)
MLDQVLQIVKQQLGSDPKVSSAIPPGQADAVHQEIAKGVTDGLKDSTSGGGLGGMISSFTGGSGSSGLSGTIQKAVADRLNGKFGLSGDAIQSITAAIPGIIQKFTGKS